MESSMTFATSLAERVGVFLLEQFKRIDKKPQIKPDFTLVTEADVQADHWISREIQEAYPQDNLLSEELHHSSPTDSSGAVWVVDPLDGTTNFSLGLAYWGTSIARLEDGYPTLAVMHFPLLGETYTARRGHGATLNGEALRVRTPDPADKSTFFVCCSRTFRSYDVSIRYKVRILGSAAYSFCTVARSMALIAFEARPKIWDLAAAWLVVEEAGGCVAAYNDASPFPISPGMDYSGVDYPTLAAASPALLQKGRTQIQAKPNSTIQRILQ
jgi:myo-inositol-1(or 4)-monophosphatase